jgi:hypothetical protein
LKRITELDPATYRRHPIHAEERAWPETNCYTDVIIELVHGMGHEPIAALPFTLAIDFECDQWTFFKFPDSDLFDLYGFDIQELAVWRPLVDHVTDQVAAGRPVLVELDSYFLPDTFGSAYKLAHVKSTVSVNEIDVEQRHMGYFHNQGYFHMGGDDFDDVFQVKGLVHERMLPPYFEYVKMRPDFVPPKGAALVEASLALLRRHFAHVPRHNPFHLFKERFQTDLEWLMKSEIAAFHTYSFATLRQYGACFELAETYLRWLGQQGVDGVNPSADALRSIAQTGKAFQFQLARAMARKKPLDLSPVDAMGADWERAMEPLRRRHG